MKEIKIIFISFVFVILLTGCKTVKQKTDALIEKENQKLSKFIGKSSDELRIELGAPDEDYRNNKEPNVVE